MNREIHRLYLDYRERHEYFGALLKLLTAAEFQTAHAEHQLLDAVGEEKRDDEQEVRFEELCRVLLRD